MPFTLSLHLLQNIAVAVIVAFHWLAARVVLRRIRRERLRRHLRLVMIGLILLLDLPLAHLFVFYKDFHPQFLDTLLHDFVGPFLALHANAALFGGAMLAHAYIIAPVVARRRNRRAAAAVPLEAAREKASAGSSLLSAPRAPGKDGPILIPARPQVIH